MVRLAGIAHNSLSNGPGTRLVVFFQGCPHRCPGCQNPETWDAAGGQGLRCWISPSICWKTDRPAHWVMLGGEPFAQARLGDVALPARNLPDV